MCASSASVVESDVGGGCCQGVGTDNSGEVPKTLDGCCNKLVAGPESNAGGTENVEILTESSDVLVCTSSLAGAASSVDNGFGDVDAGAVLGGGERPTAPSDVLKCNYFLAGDVLSFDNGVGDAVAAVGLDGVPVHRLGLTPASGACFSLEGSGGSEESVHVIVDAAVEGQSVDTSPSLGHVPAEAASVHEAGTNIVRVKKECTVLPRAAAGAAVVNACVVRSDD